MFFQISKYVLFSWLILLQIFTVKTDDADTVDFDTSPNGLNNHENIAAEIETLYEDYGQKIAIESTLKVQIEELNSHITIKQEEIRICLHDIRNQEESALNLEKNTQEKACIDQIESVKLFATQVCHDELKDLAKESEDKCINDIENVKAEQLENCQDKLNAEVENQNTECEQKLTQLIQVMSSTCAENTAEVKNQIQIECEEKIQVVTDSLKQQEEAKLEEIQSNYQKQAAEQETKLNNNCQEQTKQALSSNEEQCNLESIEEINDLTNECAEELKSSQESYNNDITISKENLQLCEISSNECNDQLQQSQTQINMLKSKLEIKSEELLLIEKELDLVAGGAYEKKDIVSYLMAVVEVAAAGGVNEKEELVLYLMAVVGVIVVLFLYILITCIVSRCCRRSELSIEDNLTMAEPITPLTQNEVVSKQNVLTKKSIKRKAIQKIE